MPVAGGERQRPQIGWGSLTPVERDVVRLVAAGHTNAEIGQRLFISVNTVKKYLSAATPRWTSRRTRRSRCTGCPA
jgi:DNA-binding CsgD family transcriptional regulator